MDESVDDWRSRPDWVEHLSTELAHASTASSDDAMDLLIDEVDGLLASQAEEVAQLLTDVALYRAARGPITRERVDAGRLNIPPREELTAELADATNPNLFAARAMAAAARVAAVQRQYGNGRALYLCAAAAFAHNEDEQNEAVSLLRAGAAAHHSGDTDAALTITERAREAYAELNDVEGEIWAVLNLSQTMNLRDEHDHARDLLDQARRLAQGRKNGHIRASIEIDDAILKIEEGDIAGAKAALRFAHRSATRRDDQEQALVAAKNLALLLQNHDDLSRSTRWWKSALTAAHKLNDWREVQDLEHSQSIALAQQGNHDEAIAALDRAIEVSREHDDPLSAARATADKGAALLDRTLRSKDVDEAFDASVAQAIDILEEARAALEELGDFEWAQIAARNLRAAWVLSNQEAHGATALAQAAEQTLAPDYARELRRNAAWLLLAAGAEADDDQRINPWLTASAIHDADDGIERAWSLAQQAASLANSGFDKTALHLYDLALENITAESQPSAYGNILNDSVLVINDEERLPEVRDRLLKVEQIARVSEDRVLLSLALSNLGETAVRMDQAPLAREYFAAAVALAQKVGNDARAAISLASLSNTYIDEGRVEDADRTSQEALRLAIRSGSDEAWVNATSASASAAYLRGDYEGAYRLWTECIAVEDPEDCGEHRAFALDSLAKTKDWPRFLKELDRVARQTQRESTQFAFVEKLHLSALTWLDQGNARGAGVVLAYGVLLAFEAASRGLGPDGRELSTADRQRSMVQVGHAMGAARAVFELMELPQKQARTARVSYERTIRRAAGADADELIETVDRYISSDDDDVPEDQT